MGACRAVRAIGTNALPTILNRFRASDSGLKGKMMGLVSKQAFIRVHFTSAATLHERAVTAFSILGPSAKPAIPDMVELLNREDTCKQAARALLWVDPYDVSPLIKALTNKSARIRIEVAATLGDIKYQSDIIVPALVKCLADKDIDVQEIAIFSLGRKEPALVTSPVIASLYDLDRESREAAVWLLGTFGKGAKAAVPVLLKLAQENDPGLHDAAVIALRRIDPTNAALASNPMTSMDSSD